MQKSCLCQNITTKLLDFIFSEEKNMGLPPIPFHHYSPLHALKVTDISVKLNHMHCEQSDFVS